MEHERSDKSPPPTSGEPRTESERYAEGSEEAMLHTEREVERHGGEQTDDSSAERIARESDHDMIDKETDAAPERREEPSPPPAEGAPGGPNAHPGDKDDPLDLDPLSPLPIRNEEPESEPTEPDERS